MISKFFTDTKNVCFHMKTYIFAIALNDIECDCFFILTCFTR